jgi:Zn finger protein HypA/HybF involved in hydrogenase expression
MHEEALLRDLLRKVDEVARTYGASHVTRVHLWVGALSHFSDAALRERWALATRATALEGSRVEVEMSTDARDPRAGGVVLRSVEVAPAETP